MCYVLVVGCGLFIFVCNGSVSDELVVMFYVIDLVMVIVECGDCSVLMF